MMKGICDNYSNITCEKHMYINLKSGSFFHYYGKLLYVVLSNGNFILLDEVETYFIEKYFKYQDLTELKKIIACENNMSENEVAVFIENILCNFKDFIYLHPYKNKYTYKVTGEKGKYYPINLIINLTNSCGQKCIHCYKGEIKSVVSLDWHLLTETLNKLKSKVPYLQLTGGEPFLYPYVCELIRKYNAFFNISITTSAYHLTENILTELKKVKLVQISLYSVEASYHDFFTATDGAFQKATNNIQQMIKNKINVRISTLLTPYNYEKLEEFVQYCIKLGVKQLKIGLIKPVGRAENEYDLCFRKNDISKIASMIEKLQKKYIHEIYIDDWSDGSNNSELQCGAGKTSLTIMENGDIQPCGFIVKDYLSMGNIYNKDLEKIIESNTSYNKMLTYYATANNICEKIC